MKILVASIAALGLASTSAIAQTTAGGGVSASTPNGSIAGGVTAGTADQQHAKKQKQKRNRQADREDRRDRQTTTEGNSASTYGSGTVYTDRNRATGGVTAGGSASGSGNQSTSTTIDAYGSTTAQGSDAEVYGDATARSRD